MEQNKWCLILGVSSGMGKACAKALSKDGWNILGIYIDVADNEPQVDALRKELAESSEQVHLINRNADNRKARQELVEEIARITDGAPIKLMLHSLAFGTLLPFIKVNKDDDVIQKNQLEMTLSVMAHSLVYWTQDLWENDLLKKGSQIFALTSGGSVMYTHNYGAVSAAKCALESHIRQLSVELAPYGISANSIRAGITDTPALRKIPEHELLLKRAADFNPTGSLATPEIIGEALVSMSKASNSWMTGNVINVDGGEILTI